MSPTFENDQIYDLLERLLRLRRQFGSRIYAAAVHAALVSVAKCVLEEAEKRAIATNVIPFPGNEKKDWDSC